MSKSLLGLFVAVLFVLGFSAGIANAGAGIFEAPQVSSPGAEVLGSEGKIKRNGDYKIEIEGVPALTTFEICIQDINLNGGNPIFLRNATSDEDGELKVEGNLSTDAVAFFPITTTTTLQAPSLQVRSNVGASDDCSQSISWESGMDVVIP